MKNPKVVYRSILGLGFVTLAFVYSNWFFMIGAVIVFYLNQKELMKKPTKVRK
jgi:hypothetical protein|tara:strand:- start:257 stop:415 length:159 start_codon:yes stop_codon:yes gene_type:complete